VERTLSKMGPPPPPQFLRKHTGSIVEVTSKTGPQGRRKRMRAGRDIVGLQDGI